LDSGKKGDAAGGAIRIAKGKKTRTEEKADKFKITWGAGMRDGISLS